jgi:hypothetical protein
MYASVAGALMLGGATAALAQEYYVVQPVANERVVVEERVVTQPAQPAAVVVPGERMTVTYNVDDPYPFPSPEQRVTQSGVFVPDQQPRVAHPAPGRVIDVQPGQPQRGFGTEPVITD